MFTSTMPRSTLLQSDTPSTICAPVRQDQLVFWRMAYSIRVGKQLDLFPSQAGTLENTKGTMDTSSEQCPLGRSATSSKFQMIRAGRTSLTCLFVALLIACDKSDSLVTHAPPAAANFQQFVSGQAIQALDNRNQFDIPGPPSSSETPMITKERAGELAVAFVKTWGRFYARDWTRAHGASINLDNLQVDPRIFYAETPFGRFPEGYHPAFRRAFGPWYLVRLTSGATPVLLIAVSAYNTDLKVDGVGKLIIPELSGNDFEAMAIARGRTGFKPVTPEEAVTHIGQATGARTSQVPSLLLLHVGTHPVSAPGAIWKLSLDRPIRVRNAKGSRHVHASEMYVGAGSKLYIPVSEQPAAHETMAIRYDSQGNRVGVETVRIPVKPGSVFSFEEAVIEEGA